MNIVHMNDFERGRGVPVKAEHTVLLRECRRQAQQHLNAALKRMLGKVDDALFELAEKAENNAVQSLYFDAMREVRLKRADMESRFEQALLAGFNAEIRGERAPDEATLDGDGMQLDLVGEDELEESLAVSNMVTKIEVNCKEQLGLLDRRMGHLLGDPELKRVGNPIGPEVICNAFLDACKNIESGIKVKLIILKLFDRYVVTEDVPPLYQALNRFLIAQGVLPDIRPVAKVRGGARGKAQPVADGGKAASAEEGALAEGGESQEDLFATLQQLIGGGTGIPGPGGSAAMATGGVGGSAAATGFLNGLTMLQQGDGELVAGGLGNIDTVAVASGRVNVIRQIKATALAEGVGGDDAMVIHVVEMLFDYILDDRNLPDPMKALIGRLQIPMLKVAMLEREFFSRKSHPARLLLNRLAEAALGWNGEQDGALYRKIEGIVQRVIVEFDEDVGLFGELLEELEAFLAEEQRKAETRVEESARLLQGKEQLKVAKARARLEVERRVRTGRVPRFIREFLVRYWQNLLLVLWVQEGEDSVAWKKAIATMDNLLWSIAPKTAEERQRLVKLLPQLLGALREGMSLISMREEDFQAFLGELADLHAERVNRATAAPAEAGTEPDMEDDPLADIDEAGEATPVEEDREVTYATLNRLIEENELAGIEVEEITLGEEEEDAAAEDDEFVDMARGLQQGAWVEFTGDDGEVTRAKLTWVSPVTGAYLFTNRQGLKAADKTLHGLAAEFRRGSARIIEDVPLFERAVSSLIEGLRQNTGV